ncbi:MAG: hypothetical protein R2824_35050 [Saprospiraceae bacterium]
MTTYRATADIIGYVPNLPEPGGELHQHTNGNHIIKYTCGVALLELPFFTIGHLLAGALGVAQNGYTLPYRLSLHLGMLFYAFLGLYLLYRVLRSAVRPGIAGLTLVVIALGSNLHYYSVYNGVMAHTTLFFLYSALLFCTVRIYRHPGKTWAFLLGMVTGLIILIRPVELICLAIPLLYGVDSRKALHDRLKFLREHWRLVLSTGLIIVCCGIPQLLYWKYSTGQFLYYSYADEGFNWLHPKIMEGLFSYKNGWLTYTPVMVMALAGIYFLFRRKGRYFSSSRSTSTLRTAGGAGIIMVSVPVLWKFGSGPGTKCRIWPSLYYVMIAFSGTAPFTSITSWGIQKTTCGAGNQIPGGRYACMCISPIISGRKIALLFMPKEDGNEYIWIILKWHYLTWNNFQLLSRSSRL